MLLKEVLMPPQPDFDLQSAHRYFSAQCFNQAWALIKKPNRTPEDNEAMISLSHASHYHWTQREDYSSTNRSIALWQLAHIYTLLGRMEQARNYADLCLQASREEGVEVVFLGYAYEALARTEKMAGNLGKAQQYLASALEQAEKTDDEEDRQMLLDDLADLRAD
jgi:tetratricopeptide (TPR) repeat protein